MSPSKCGDGGIDNAICDIVRSGHQRRYPHPHPELNAQGGNSVVAIVTKILDEPNMDLRTKVVEGLCKLLMISAISSPKLGYSGLVTKITWATTPYHPTHPTPIF